MNLEKFNIDITDYFQLAESDKEEITQIIVEIYSKVLDVEPMFVHRYYELINLSITTAVDKDDYERAEIMNRVLFALKKKYKKFETYSE